MHNEGEPSVEDILRSIKKVISRDDENAAQAGHTPTFGASRPFAQREAFSRAAPSDPPVAANAAQDDDAAGISETDVYDLSNLPGTNQPAEELPPVTLPAAFAMAEDRTDPEDMPGEADAPEFEPEPAPTSTAPPPVAEPAPEPRQTPLSEEGLVTHAAAAAMRDRLSALSSISAKAPKPESTGGPLEEVVREMLRPMLKSWLDDNLEGIIERMVEAEIARITGRR